MKVLHVIARMNVGGTATYIHNLMTGLEARGVTQILAVGYVPENEKEDIRIGDLKYSRIESLSRSINPMADQKSLKELKGVVANFKPDLIHSHTFKAGFISRLRYLGVPNIHTFHGHHLYDPEFGFISRGTLNFVEKRLAKRSAKLLTIGSRVAQELQATRIGKPSQYVSIPPGIRELRRVDGHAVRDRLGIDDAATVVLWLGRFTQVKRPDLVVEIAKAIPQLTFVMAGDGELQARIRESAPRNLMIIGVQDAAEMWAIADLGLLTSDSEGMPLSVIEAQMCGVPVIATDVGSVSEIIEDGVTGALVTGGAVKISLAIRELLANHSKLASMRKSAKKRARELFSQDVMVESHLRVYEEVLSKVSE